jgi:hypothetical protein
VLNDHTARAYHIEACDIDVLVIGGLGGAAFIQSGLGANELGGMALRRLFPVGVQVQGHQIVLAGHQLFDAPC